MTTTIYPDCMIAHTDDEPAHSFGYSVEEENGRVVLCTWKDGYRKEGRCMTPDVARKLAAAMIQFADKIEA